MSHAADRLRLVLLSLTVAALAACGGSGAEEEDAAPVQSGSPSPSPSPAPSPSPSPSPAPSPAPAPAALGSATLQWGTSSDARVVGYRVYWGTASRRYQARGTGAPANSDNSHVVGSLQSGRTYYFAVTAYDGAGTESDFSAEATKTIP
jgi:Fibronectin type III domain